MGMESMPSSNFMTQMFGQGSGALDRFQSSSINLGSFPSLPVGSGVDFDHIMQQQPHGHGHDGLMTSVPPSIVPSPFQNMSRIGSMSMGKLESMELPETVAHLLHDMPPEHRDQAGAERTNSGLESMQSIEQALGNVEENPVEKFAEDYWMNNGPQASANNKSSRGQS